MTKERAALVATRSRLEAALSEDENWRALKQLRTQPADDQRAPRRLRDARLELLLLSNPLFRAWKHVDDAIEDLRKNDSLSKRLSSSGTLAPARVLVSAGSAKEVASLADLSRGIARLIQRGMPDGDPEPVPEAETDDHTPLAGQQARERRPVTVEMSPDVAVKRQPLAIASVEPARPVEVKLAAEAPPTGREPDRVPERGVRNVGQPRMNVRPKEPERDESPFSSGADAEEATVTFVTREAPAARRSPTPSDRGSNHGSEPLGSWAHASNVLGPEDADSLHSSNSLIEEAEVTILTEESIKLRQETAQRDGNLRRFRKALLGE
jgi:hypothetical protein